MPPGVIASRLPFIAFSGRARSSLSQGTNYKSFTRAPRGWGIVWHFADFASAAAGAAIWRDASDAPDAHGFAAPGPQKPRLVPGAATAHRLTADSLTR